MIELDEKLISSMLTSLRKLLERLKTDRDTIDDEIRRVEGDIAKLTGEPVRADTNGTKRKRRGKNEQIIRDLFSQEPGLSLTPAEIKERTGMPRTSAKSALERMDDAQQDDDGRWHMKPQKAVLAE